MPAITTDIFIQRARETHGDKYDYSQTKYINASTKVFVICSEHGGFWMLPHNHLRGQGCPCCGNNKKNQSNTIWTPDEIIIHAKQYSSLKELREENPRLYSAAKKKGIDLSFLPKQYHEEYSREEYFAVAKKYKYRNEFRKNEPSIFTCGTRNGWYSECDWFETPPKYNGDMKRHNHSIYVYEHKESKVAYVGLTNNLKRRHREHSSVWKGHHISIVYSYFHSLGLEVPAQIIVESGLTPRESQGAEAKWIERYKSEGWYLLNQAETGFGISSLGSYARIWDYEACKQEAGKYRTTREFMEQSRGAYASSLSNGWIDEFFPNKQQARSRTKETFIEASHKYNSIHEFIKGDPSMYSFGKKMGWIEECVWLRKGRQITKWTLEACLKEASKYMSYTDFAKGSPNVYRAANRNGFTNHIKSLFK